MIFSYNWLQSFFDKKLPSPNLLAEKINLKLFEVEEVKKVNDDWAIKIDILPNRAGDCFSHLGVAREISAITGLKMIEKKSSFKKKSKSNFKIEIKDKESCPRYLAVVLRNINVESSPSWIKERLKVCGVQSINNIVDIVNYAMLETGQPMHAFDLDKISGNKIIVRKARKNETIHALDNKKYSLNEKTLLISDPEKILGIAGIKGGKNAEIDEKTKNIIVESANFDRVMIRKASNFLKIRTDASLRFEHGIDSSLSETGALKALEMISEIAGGEIDSITDIYSFKRKKEKLTLDLNYLNSLLGASIDKSTAKKILVILGFKIVKDEKDVLKIEAPDWRVDISCQEDLIEEVGRIYGYERIKSIMPQATIDPPQRNQEFYWLNKVRNFFKNVGFSETYNHSFINDKEAGNFNYNLDNLIEVEKPVSLEQRYLRPSLIPKLLNNSKENEKFINDFKIFEIGNVFTKKGSQFKEKKEVAGLITGNSFYQTKGTIELLFNELGISQVEFKSLQEKDCLFHLNKRAQILINKERVGFLGLVSRRVLNPLKIKSDISLFYLDFDLLKDRTSKDIYYSQIPKFPLISRDISIVVPEKEGYLKIENCINRLKLDKVEEIIFSDSYQGKEIPQKKKSLTLRIVYRDNQRTLNAQEVNSFHEKIIKEIEKNKDWQVRK